MLVAQKTDHEESVGKVHIIDEDKRSSNGIDFARAYCGLEPCRWFFSDYEFSNHRKLHPNSPKRDNFCKTCLRMSGI